MLWLSKHRVHGRMHLSKDGFHNVKEPGSCGQWRFSGDPSWRKRENDQKKKKGNILCFARARSSRRTTRYVLRTPCLPILKRHCSRLQTFSGQRRVAQNPNILAFTVYSYPILRRDMSTLGTAHDQFGPYMRIGTPYVHTDVLQRQRENRRYGGVRSMGCEILP